MYYLDKSFYCSGNRPILERCYMYW